MIAATSKMSILFELTRGGQWEAVAVRCQTHPDEVKSKEQDEGGLTILHWACRGATLEFPRLPPVFFVVEAILLGCPELAMIRNSNGMLPVHLACGYALSSDIIRALIQAYPPSAGMVIDSDQLKVTGVAPLHLLYRNKNKKINTDSVRAVLECSAGVASTRLKDKSGKTPMEILNDHSQAGNAYKYLNLLLRPRWRRGQQQDQVATEPKAVIELIHETGFWEHVEWLALAEYTQKPMATRGHPCVVASRTTVFHALVSIWHVPHATIRLAPFLIPQTLMQKDEHGDLPLHLAIRGKGYRMIENILHAQPLAAAIPDGTGALPLQIFLGRSNVQSWGDPVIKEELIKKNIIKKLIHAFPPAVHCLGLDRRLYPLLLSRLNRQPNTLFLSIQSAPDDVFLDSVV